MKPVWIVDDDRSIRWVLEKTLAREQIPFKSFASANEALALLDAGGEAPQVLLSDIRMPGQSGLDLLQQVKARFPALPVIITVACDWLRRPMARNTSCMAGAWPRISGVSSTSSDAPAWCELSSIARRISSSA